MGKAGQNKLNKARKRFNLVRVSNMDVSIGPNAIVDISQLNNARSRLTVGPAMAIRNSAKGLLGMYSILAMPPKKSNVILGV
jgi:hypothetical protein